jgi:hypothetical protein
MQPIQSDYAKTIPTFQEAAMRTIGFTIQTIPIIVYRYYFYKLYCVFRTDENHSPTKVFNTSVSF